MHDGEQQSVPHQLLGVILSCCGGAEGRLSTHCRVLTSPVQRAKKLVSVHCIAISSGVADMNARHVDGTGSAAVRL